MSTGHKAQISELETELRETKEFCNALMRVLIQIEAAAKAHHEGVTAITKQFMEKHREMRNL